MKPANRILSYPIWVVLCIAMLSTVSCRKAESEFKQKNKQLAANKTSEYDSFMADSVNHRRMLAITAKAFAYLSKNEDFNSVLISSLGGTNMTSEHSMQLRTLKQQLGNSTYILYFDSALNQAGLGEEDQTFFYNNDDSMLIGGTTTYPAIYIPGLFVEYQSFNDNWSGRFPARIYTTQRNIPEYPNPNDEFDIPAYYYEGSNLVSTTVSNQNLMSLRGWQVYLDILPSYDSSGHREIFSLEILNAGRISGMDCHCRLNSSVCNHGCADRNEGGCGKDHDGCGCPPCPEICCPSHT